MIVDAFMFFNELDTLEIRLRELAPVVDQFLILECGEALSGVQKPYIFDENQARFSAFADKIIRVKLAGLPPLVEDTEERRFWLESFQRNFILAGLVGRGLKHDDLVLISDVDEIPSRSAVEQASRTSTGYDTMVVFKQTYYKHFFDLELPEELRGRRWLGTVAVRYGTFGHLLPNDIRLNQAHAGRFYDAGKHERLNRVFIENAGWHLTYFGGEKSFNYKVANFSHGAKNNVSAKRVPVALIAREFLTGLRQYDDRLGAELETLVQLSLSNDLPFSVLNNLQDYYHMFRASFAEKPLSWL